MDATISTQEDYVLKLFNLDHQNIDCFHVSHAKDGVYVKIKLLLKEYRCPVCDTPTSSIKGYTTKIITHSALSHTPCYITYQARRMLCPVCHKTFYEYNPFTFTGMKISLLTVYNVLNDLKKPNETLTSVAARHHISATTVSSIFDNHVQIARKPLPKVLCIDEVYTFKSENSDYVCVLLDYVTQNIVDLLPNRHKSGLLNYFHLIPAEERAQVELVSIDMWKTYRAVTKLMLPKAKLAVDKFHVMQEFVRKFDRCRIDAMNAVHVIGKKKDDSLSVQQRAENMRNENLYYVYKKFNWLLYKIDDDILDPNREKKFNHKLNRYLNYHDLRDIMLEANVELKEAYNLYFLLQQFYKLKSEVEAAKNINNLIQLFKDSNIASMNKFANTLVEWKKEIINSFIIVSYTNKKINNAIIENTNKTIKTMKHNSNGFTNWDRFRNRVLYVINDDASYNVYPKNAKDQAM